MIWQTRDSPAVLGLWDCHTRTLYRLFTGFDPTLWPLERWIQAILWGQWDTGTCHMGAGRGGVGWGSQSEVHQGGIFFTCAPMIALMVVFLLLKEMLLLLRQRIIIVSNKYCDECLETPVRVELLRCSGSVRMHNGKVRFSSGARCMFQPC